MSKQNDGLIYKLTWIMNDEKSEYKQQILEQAINALTKYENTNFTPEEISAKTIACGNGTLTVEDAETFGPQWHDVEKELPKRGEDCLCHVQYGIDRDCNDVVISQLGRYKRFSIEQNVDGVKVLHWMPIPPLPKEDDASGIQEVHLDGSEC